MNFLSAHIYAPTSGAGVLFHRSQHHAVNFAKWAAVKLHALRVRRVGGQTPHQKETCLIFAQESVWEPSCLFLLPLRLFQSFPGGLFSGIFPIRFFIRLIKVLFSHIILFLGPTYYLPFIPKMANRVKIIYLKRMRLKRCTLYTSCKVCYYHNTLDSLPHDARLIKRARCRC